MHVDRANFDATWIEQCGNWRVVAHPAWQVID